VGVMLKLKSIGLTVVATAVAVLSLGCVRGLVSPTAPAADQIYMAKPMSGPAEIVSSEATVLWREIGIYRVSGPLRMAGPMYELTSFATKAECEAARPAPLRRLRRVPRRSGLRRALSTPSR